MNAVLGAALEYVERGWRVLPVTADKEPNWPLLKDTRGTAGWRGLRDEPAEATEVRRWFELDAATGIAIICGAGVVVVDVDHPEHPDVPDLPETATVSTARPGRSHRYYSFAGELHSQTYAWGELRSNGDYVVAPASTGANGHRYRWTREGELAELDACLVSTLRARAVVVGATKTLCSLYPTPTRPTKTESTYRGKLEDVDRDEALVRRLGVVLGLPDLPLERAFHCVLHRDQRPSAALHRARDGRILYHCFAGCGYRGDGQGGWLSLPSLYAWQSGRRRRLGRVELVLWRLRLLEEAGLITADELVVPEPPEISETARLVLAGFLRLLRLRWLTTPGKPTPFVSGFAGPWSGVSPREAETGFNELVRLGLVRSAGSDPRGMRLWLPEGVVPLT